MNWQDAFAQATVKVPTVFLEELRTHLLNHSASLAGGKWVGLVGGKQEWCCPLYFLHKRVRRAEHPDASQEPWAVEYDCWRWHHSSPAVRAFTAWWDSSGTEQRNLLAGLLGRLIQERTPIQEAG